MYGADESQALASRARLVARAVVGLVLEEERAARFVYSYTTEFQRQGIAGEAERKVEFLAAIERESLLLVASRIERTLPPLVGSRFSRPAVGEAVAGFRQAFLTFLGGSLAWDNEERESFHKDLAMYLRLSEREGRRLSLGRGKAPAAGAFVDRCAFLIDPSMMMQAREAVGRYQVELESCADQAVRAAFRGLRSTRHAPRERADLPPRPTRPSPPRKARKPAKARSPQKKKTPRRATRQSKRPSRKRPAPKRKRQPAARSPRRPRRR